MFRRSTCLLAVCAMALTACDDDATSPEDALTEDDVAFLALEIDASLLGVFDDYYSTSSNGPAGVPAMAAEPVTTTYSYERSRECAAGGSISVAGNGSRTVDRELGTVDVENSGTKTRSDCARTRGDVTITIDGSGSFTHDRHWLDREPTGVWTTTHEGNIDWSKSSGESGSCSFDLTSLVDTAANTRSVTGTMCGRDIDRSGTWRSNG